VLHTARCSTRGSRWIMGWMYAALQTELTSAKYVQKLYTEMHVELISKPQTQNLNKKKKQKKNTPICIQ